MLDTDDALITVFAESGVFGLDPSKLVFDCMGKPDVTGTKGGETNPVVAAIVGITFGPCTSRGKLVGTIGCIIGCTIG